MASIYKEVLIATSVESAWAALRQPGEARTLFAPVLVDSHVDGDLRTVRFANGLVVEERIITIDDVHRRIVYAAVKGTPMTHHNASLQIFAEGDGSRAVWIADLLPHELGPAITGMIAQGLEAMKKTLER